MGKKRTIEQRQEELFRRIQGFCLLDDDFMTKCFEENKEAVELVLRIVLEKKDIQVEKVFTQYTMKNIKGRSLRLDVYATDSCGKKYNIEIQRMEKGAGAKRARYNSSLIDSNILPSGVEVDNLAETYVIFITETDVIGKNKPVYHIDRCIRETGELFQDGSHILYVNASYKDDSELGKLMHDFSCTNPDDMNYSVLADTARYYKEEKEGMYTMGRVMEELRKDWIEEEKRDIALRLVETGKLSLDEIAECSRLPLEEVKRLAEEALQPV